MSLEKKPFNSQWKCIKPEDLKKGTYYAITVNPREQYDRYMFARLERVDASVCLFFSKRKECKVILKREVSSLGRIHYHGKITIQDIEDFYVYAIPALKLFGAFEIDTIEDENVWFTYCTKQKSIWKKYKKNHSMKIEFVPENPAPKTPSYFLPNQIIVDCEPDSPVHESKTLVEEGDEECPCDRCFTIGKDNNLYCKDCLPPEQETQRK